MWVFCCTLNASVYKTPGFEFSKVKKVFFNKATIADQF